MIELYAITDRPVRRLPDGAPLVSVERRGLAAVGASAGTAALSPSPDALWHHEERLEALMAECDLLPVRYGTLLADEAAVGRVLDERRDELARALGRVRGAVELSLRAVAEDPEPPLPRDAGGAQHLRERARRAAARTELARALHDPLSRLARATTQRTPRAPGELLRAAYLVDRDAVSGFTLCVSALEEAHPEARLLCTGPWPPYSFTGG